MTPEKPKVIAIVGPTCTGKTALSLWLAQEFGGEIIACDSRTLYRHFDIGTAKPTQEEQQIAPHHLIDVAEPEEDFTVARFTDLASRAVNEITARGHVPIVCGGTGFYSRALLEGLSIPAVPPNEQLRSELQALADNEGNEKLHAKLAELDPITAGKLNANDRFRVIRALEVCIETGQPFSEVAGRREEPFNTLWIGLTIADREALKRLIILRLKEQMRQGMLAEVQGFHEKYGRSNKLMHTVNYRDLVLHLEGAMTLDEAVAECERHNYQLARRQIQWFRANPKINWFNVDQVAPDELRANVRSLVQRFSEPVEK